ncbi:SpoIID/LytB domain-containing protein [Nocardia farcinica]
MQRKRQLDDSDHAGLRRTRRRIRLRIRNRVGPPTVRLRPVLATGGTVLLVGGALAYTQWPVDRAYEPLAGPGHGRGMSQVGAFDSAQEGWLAERILAHYYPGATLGTVPPTTLAVRLMDQDDAVLDAYADAGARVAGRTLEPGQVAHLTPLADGGANVVVTLGCDGDVLWQTSTADPWIYPLDPNPGRPAEEHLTLCNGRAYRGSLGVATEDGAFRTVNRVDVEDYLLGVVPAEVQANWADKGAGEALRAQAVAARSYALAEQRYPYAQTCDTTDCQVYPGTEKEDPRTAAAVASTAGQVLLRDGHILRSEYSAAPDGGAPADIQTFEVGPRPADLEVARPPADPRTRAAETPSAIDVEYERIGGANSTLGTPLGPEWGLPQNAGTYRLFTNGVIIATPTLGAQVVDFTTLMELIPGTDGLDTLPTETVPTETVPSETVPTETVPSDTVPPGTVPSGGDPGGAPPVEALPRHPAGLPMPPLADPVVPADVPAPVPPPGAAPA